MLQDENPAVQMLSRDGGSIVEYKIQYENVRFSISDFKLRYVRSIQCHKDHVGINKAHFEEFMTIMLILRLMLMLMLMFDLEYDVGY